MKRILFVFLGVVLILGITSVGFAEGQAEEGEESGEKHVTLGTSSPGGSYYLYGGGIASYINSNRDDMVVTSQTTKGSNENVRLIGDRLDVAFANGSATYTSRSEEGLTDSRAIFTVDIAPSHWVTLEGRDVNKIEDLVGKKFSIGAPGSGTESTNRNILQAYNIWEEVEGDVERLGFSESATVLKDGNIALFAGSSALPMPAVSELATLRDAKLLSLEDWALDNLREEHPPYQKVTIPSGTYEGIDEDVVTAGVPSCFITHKDVPDEVIYKMVKTLFTEKAKEHMKNVYYAWSPTPNQDFFESIDMPIHPGAKKFYEEEGMID